MRLLGFEITRVPQTKQVLNSVYNSGQWWGPWWGPITESFAGAWQTNTVVTGQQTLLQFPAVYACVTGISSDIGKNPIKLTERDRDGIWNEVTDSPFLPVLRKPNHYQNRIQFIEHWILSKLLHGNTYVLKQRDQRGIVNAMYVLHPTLVKPLVAEDGSVYYDIGRDDLSQTDEIEKVDTGERIVVPASEIIHDMMPALFHPLIGVSPLYACALAATLGNRIADNSSTFFANQSMPGGILTAPGAISDETAARLKAAFEEKFGTSAAGVNNRGRLAVLGDGLKFEPMRMTNEHAQLVEQAKLTREDVAMVFRYPLHKLTGQPPPYAGSMEASQVSYYVDCLQDKIEKIELSLDEGLDLPSGKRTEVDVDNLLRMDTAAMYEVLDKAREILTPNESRFVAGYRPVPGGNSVLRQQQNFSLEALAKRDAQDDPFGTNTPATPAPESPEPKPEDDSRSFDAEDLELLYGAEFRKELALR